VSPPIATFAVLGKDCLAVLPLRQCFRPAQKILKVPIGGIS